MKLFGKEASSKLKLWIPCNGYLTKQKYHDMKYNSFKRIFYWLILAGCYFSVGCIPIYNDDYTFIAPTAQKSKACIRQCETSKHQCSSLEKKKKAYCSLQVELACDEKMNWLEDKNRRCASHYRHCYQACGGKVQK